MMKWWTRENSRVSYNKKKKAHGNGEQVLVSHKMIKWNEKIADFFFYTLNLLNINMYDDTLIHHACFVQFAASVLHFNYINT